MNWHKCYKPLLCLLAALLLSLNGVVQNALNSDRKQLDLIRTDNPLDNAPPALAFTTVALGGFRGLVSNILWMRATQLQQDGKYFEMVQLADWITKLQPGYVEVWRMQAWNMAYNISVKFPEGPARYNWVMSGIELLRDEAIPLNPKEPNLYYELARFYQHKIGDMADLSHMHYKTLWASEWQQNFGEKMDFAALVNPRTPEALEQVRLLREKYKMDPALMKDVEDEYGPLEWRLPETHAIYWSVAGIRKCDLISAAPLRRMIYQALRLAVRRGRLIENKADGHMLFGPNLEIIGVANRTYVEMMELEPDFRQTIENGHRNFLMRVIKDLYVHNRRDEAQKWMDYAEGVYPDLLLHPEQPLDDFVLEFIGDELSANSPDDYKNLLMGCLDHAYFKLALGEDDQFEGYQRTALQLRNRMMKEVTNPGKTNIVSARMIPTIPKLKTQVIKDIFSTNSGWSVGLKLQLATRLGDTLDQVLGTNWVATNLVNRAESEERPAPDQR